MTARGDSVKLRAVLESTFGTTPVNSTAWKALRFTSEDLTHQLKTDSNDEIAGQIRGTRDKIKTGIDASGGFGFDLTTGDEDQFLEAILGGTWSANVLVPGTTVRSFSIEKEYPDIPRFLIYKGMAVSSLNLDFQARQVITGKVGFNGANLIEQATSLVGTGSTTAAGTGSAYRTGASITGLKLNGVTAASLNVRAKSIAVSFEQSQSLEEVIDSDTATGSVMGALKIGVDMELYFDNQTILALMLAGTAFAVEFLASNGAKSYKFEFPKVFFDGAPGGASADGGIMLSIKGEALVDTGAGFVCRITRVP